MSGILTPSRLYAASATRSKGLAGVAMPPISAFEAALCLVRSDAALGH